MSPPLKYVASLAHVREVSLRGTADLHFWMDWLRDPNLKLASSDERAQILIVSADSKYLGIPFREVSISLILDPPDDRLGQDAAYLLQAYNSCRMFAFCERTLFRTPYDHADCQVTVTRPASIQVRQRGELLMELIQAAEPHPELEQPHQAAWHGPVFLPQRLNRREPSGKFFVADIHGNTSIFPFVRSQDRAIIHGSPSHPLLRALLDSQFEPLEWIIRADAHHAKSKTYRRA